MKKFILLAVCAGTFCFTQAQLKMPAASPGQYVKQDFGLSSVELSYSRPVVKGRIIFGDLVPWNKVWRTGANGATTITFGDEVSFGGQKVPAGKYGLLTIPNPTDWTVILTKQLDVTSPAAYKQDQDVARVKVSVDDLPFSLESLLISFSAVLPSSMELVIGWDRTLVRIPVTTDIDAKINAQIESLKGKENFPYFNAAAYYLEKGKDLNTALGWFDKAAQQSPDAYWVFYQKAKCEAKLGKNKEAIASANKSIALATAAKNDDYVTLNQKLIATLK